jgi:hypothetical protein
MCGIPLDARYFDESSVTLEASPGVAVIRPGSTLVLARFALPLQYCGVLEYFAQHAEQSAVPTTLVKTPGLEWTLLSNDHPLDPYIQLDRILNPWGYGSFPVAFRLGSGSTLTLTVRGVDSQALTYRAIGGRIVGRYWYNPAYGDGG